MTNETAGTPVPNSDGAEVDIKSIPAHLLPIQDFSVPGLNSKGESLPDGLNIPVITERSKRLPQPIEFSKPPSKKHPTVSPDGTMDVTYYKGNLPSFRVIFPWGVAANFVKHVYATTDLKEIEYLDDEAENIGLLKATGVMDVEELTNPMVAFKNKIIREFLAEQAQQRAVANNPMNDAGMSDPKFAMAGIGAASTRMAIDPAAMMAAAANAAAPEGGGAQTFQVGDVRGHLASIQARMGKKG